MKITLLGTGSPLPDPNRAGPSTLVSSGAHNVVVDCGRACVMRLTAAGVFPPFVNLVLLTHLHSDHICDLNDLVTTRWITTPTAMASPLKIVGPVGTRRVVTGMLEMLALDEQYRLAHHEDLRTAGGMKIDVVELHAGDVHEHGDMMIGAFRTDHRPVEPTLGYRITHDTKVAALAGDTIPCDELYEMCRHADVYVQTVLRDDLVKGLASALPGNAARLTDILDYHSTVQQAGQTASRSGVKHLVLTHYVPAMQPGTENEWRSLAAQHFAGPITLGPDLTSVEV
ncbi:MAG: MBL fold metallo-hydrolase [Actinomycetota bacterium]